MRRISLNARIAQEKGSTAELYAALFEITHPTLPKPIRLTSDNAERISKEPYVMGARSNWRGANPITEPFLWIAVSVLQPGDQDDAPAAMTLVLENIDDKLTKLLRSFIDFATISMAIVLADTPNNIEAEWTGMDLTTSTITGGEVSLQFSREAIEDESFPPGRMTRFSFPGLQP